MKPINFNESNTVYVADGCGDLPVYKDESQIASCWKLSFKERIKALLYGRVWLCVLGKNQPPVWLECSKTVFKESE